MNKIVATMRLTIIAGKPARKSGYLEQVLDHNSSILELMRSLEKARQTAYRRRKASTLGAITDLQ